MTEGFTIVGDKELPIYNGHGTLLKHDRTGMNIFYFRPEKNNENYFCFNFKTPAEDDSGIAHALEHMVLQGSKNYPVKNMFFHLRQISPAIKMNAVTSSYRTSFYAETYIPEDYYRLLQAYGDAVFFPLLNENSFKQEVWRFDLDGNRHPSFNGVVFNEVSSLKKVSVHNNNLFEKEKLYQNSENAFNYGGDFLEVPELTRDKLKDFHKKYYTPANCLLLLFGKIDLDEQLHFLENKLLCHLPEGTIQTVIKDDIIPLPSMSELKIEIPYNGDVKGSVSLNILCKDEVREESIERDFFINQIGVMLEKQLKFCDIGNFSASLKSSPKHKYFICTLDSVNKEDNEKAKKLLIDSLEHCLDDGMDYDELKAACNQRDLIYKNKKALTNFDTLKTFLVNGWVENDDPFLGISKVEEEWDVLKKRLLSYKDEDFRILLKKYVIENQNKVFTIETPDQEYFNKIEIKRAEVLKKKFKESEKSISDIEKEKEDFENFLKQDDSRIVQKLFPPLEIKELKNIDDEGIDVVEEIEGKYGSVFLFSSAQETEEKVRVSVYFGIDHLSQDEFQQLLWISYVLECFGFAGMKSFEIETLSKDKGFRTISCKPRWIGSVNCSENKAIYENRYWAHFDIYCNMDSLDECLKFFSKSIYERNFSDIDERNYAKEMLIESYKKKSYVAAGKFAEKNVSSYFTEIDALLNKLTGLNIVDVKKSNLSKDIDSILDDYISIYEKIINGSAVVNVFCNQSNLEKAKNAVKEFVKQTEIKPLEKNRLEYLSNTFPETSKKISTIITPSSSGSVVLKFCSSKYPSKDYSAERVFINWFNSKILYDSLRKKYGVYGSECTINSEKNVITISTTRDPSPGNSLKIIEESLEQLKNLELNELITEQLVKELALKEYALTLAELTPERKGIKSFISRLNGRNPEISKTMLKYILEISMEEFIEAGKRIYEKSRNFKACIVTGDEAQICGEVICDMRKS